MRQFVLPPDYDGGDRIRISGADGKYILRVLRLTEGREFPATDRGGRRYTLKITETGTDAGGDWFSAACSPRAERGESMPDIILLQCLPKGKKLETIIRQAVDAGAAMIIPVESEHSVARIMDDKNSKKTARLQKIAEEAAQQSGNRGVPEIFEAVRMIDLPAFLEKQQIDGIKLFFHQERLEQGSLHGYL